MRHRANPRFWRCSRQLPEQVQRLADECYQLLRHNPRHPSSHFRRIGRFWSVRVGLHYRALAVEYDGDVVWFWVGPHVAKDPYPEGRKLAEYANDPKEPPIQYDLYRIPFKRGQRRPAESDRRRLTERDEQCVPQGLARRPLDRLRSVPERPVDAS